MSILQHRWVIDALEESIASIEVDGGTMIRLPRSLLPAGVREGQIVKVSIEIDEAATRRVLADSKAQVAKHAKQKKDPGGDVVL